MGVGRTDALVTECLDFLAERLREDLARLWQRDPAGMPALVAALDEQLVAIDAGRLPDPRDLRVLLWGYGGHADYDPTFTDLLRGR